jgi:hypothetical protein
MWMLWYCVTCMPTGHDGIEDSGGFSGFPPHYPLYDENPLSRLRVTHTKKNTSGGEPLGSSNVLQFMADGGP